MMEADESASFARQTMAKQISDKRLLIERLQKTHNLTLEATFLSSWQSLGMKFETSLAVPACNFDPQQKGQIRCEPVVLCEEENGRVRVLSSDEFEAALMDVRETANYEDWSAKTLFDKSRPAPVLLGVANLSLAPLAYDIRFSHVAPVFGTQGEIAARVHCEIRRILVPDSSSCEIRIREVNEVPEELDQFVFCQYRFPGEDEPSYALPAKQFRHLCAPGAVPFNHSMTFKLNDESVFSTVLPIEVWGHPRHATTPLRRDNSLLVKQIGDKWRSFKCLLMLSVGIKELGDSGIWHPVPNSPDPRVAGCAGFFKIRQGHSHIITVKVRPIRTPGSLPVSISEISKVEVGCVHCCKGPISNQLDSYHEEDLITLRDMWLKALDERKSLLQQQIEASNGCEEKEKKLIDRLVNLTEERNLVELPPAGSGIPGSPADWTPPPGLEKHSPLLLLLDRACIDIPLSEERQDEFLALRFLPRGETNSRTSTQVQCHWDPTSHESAWLNQISEPDVFVFLIVRAHVQLKAGNHDGERTVILRKRVPVQITRRTSGNTWFSKILLLPALQHGAGRTNETAVIYELVSHLPHAIFETEPRDQLARSAAQSVAESASDSTNLLNEYLAQIGELDELLLDDQKRQGIILTDALVHAGRKPGDTIPLPKRDSQAEVCKTEPTCSAIETEKAQEEEIWRNNSYCRATSPTDSEKTLKVDCASISTVTDATLNGSSPPERTEARRPSQLIENHVLESQAQRSLSLPEWLVTGQRVIVCTNSVNQKSGLVRYIGPTAIKRGIWIGVELDTADGKNDGSYKGKQYFSCRPDHGVFVRPDKLIREK